MNKVGEMAVMLHMARHGYWRRAGNYGLRRTRFIDWAQQKGYKGIFLMGDGGILSPEGDSALVAFICDQL